MTTPAQDPVRVSRRRRKHERQAVVFGVLIAFLVIAGLGAAAIYSGTITAPFSEPIKSPSPPTATMQPVCLPETADGTPPVPYEDVRVRVYNGADPRFALAGANEDVLADRGFDIRDTGDFSRLIVGTSEIRYGLTGVAEAYTLAAQFGDIELILDDREGGVVDLVVGPEWVEPLPEDQVPLAAGEPMENLPGCLPADQLTPVEREYGLGREPDADVTEVAPE
ncbi:LytR C-terminal domain-containing protein [Isoptericola jiangsuensis]|uniref:LytR C-terminal domain-containing protein n=1 Tax=Isoptericola jiangsuensis TaxID=548579 RepID=UPI003AAB089B